MDKDRGRPNGPDGPAELGSQSESAANAAARGSKGARRAVVVGINEYADPRNRLPSCVNDAITFKDLLEGQYGFDEVRLLTDADANRAGVVDALDWMFTGAAPDDRLVLFFSGHGTQMSMDGVTEEFLVLHDDRFRDNELSDRTQSLPDGVFTAVIDACFSGGEEKRLYEVVETSLQSKWKSIVGKLHDQVPLSPMGMGKADVARVKAYLPEPEEMEQIQRAESRAAWYKPFLGKPKMMAGAPLAKILNPPSDEEGQVQMKGMLLAASSELETAAASSSTTNGLSAFTFAFVAAVRKLGHSASVSSLIDETQSILAALGFRQAVVIKEPVGSLHPAQLSLFNLHAPAQGADTVNAALATLLRNLSQLSFNKEQRMATANMGSPEIWEVLARAVIPPLVESLAKQRSAQSRPQVSDFNGAPLLESLMSSLRGSHVEPKSDIGDAIRTLGAIVKGVQPQQKGPSFNLSDWAPLIVPLLGALQGQQASQKSDVGDLLRLLGGVVKAPQSAQKIFGIDDAILIPAAASVIAALIKSYRPEPEKSYLNDLIQQAGGVSKSQQPEQKLFGIDASIVVPLAAAVIQALARNQREQQKASWSEEAQPLWPNGVIGALLNARSNGEMRS